MSRHTNAWNYTFKKLKDRVRGFRSKVKERVYTPLRDYDGEDRVERMLQKVDERVDHTQFKNLIKIWDTEHSKV